MFAHQRILLHRHLIVSLETGREIPESPPRSDSLEVASVWSGETEMPSEEKIDYCRKTMRKKQQRENQNQKQNCKSPNQTEKTREESEVIPHFDSFGKIFVLEAMLNSILPSLVILLEEFFI